MPRPVRVLSAIAVYAVTVVAVVLGVLLTADGSAVPWLALLAAMAIVHLGLGILLARWSLALLPLLLCVAAWLLDLGDFSITTLLVGVPCAMLVVSGVALRVGWDGGPEVAPVSQIRRERARERRRREQDTGDWDPIQPLVWDDATA